MDGACFLLSASEKLLPTPTVGSAGTDTMEISYGSQLVAISHGPWCLPSLLVSPSFTISHVLTRYPTDTPFRVPLLTFW